MKVIRPLLVVFGGLSLITGLAYPLATTASPRRRSRRRPTAA
ncbi:Uncharacterised protein [Chromobacterium violaceum]|uniref:Potassium-transporting ATPase subunit C n=1 Tax=Chromobacterium violaceum TaxID=536 RepID=A0A3S4HKX5_CHRVL|nr:Uncharacterised protein [Chromobacterium violaceum]